MTRKDAINIVDAIIKDLSDRRGLRHEWEQIDRPIRVEIRETWIELAMSNCAPPVKHKYWGAGEADCPKEIKAGNGELHTLRCKVCGQDSPREPYCDGAPNVKVSDAPH
jgi:hypothetical protein